MESPRNRHSAFTVAPSLAIGLVLFAVSGMAKVVAQEPPPPEKESTAAEKQLEALIRTQNEANIQWGLARNAAKTKQEQAQVDLQFGAAASPLTYSSAFSKIVQRYPNDPGALKALIWLLMCDAGGAATAEAANAISDELISGNGSDITQFCSILSLISSGPIGDRMLRKLIEKNPHREVQAFAHFARCSRLKHELDGQLKETARSTQTLENMLHDVIATYGDIPFVANYGDTSPRGETFKQKAKSMLYEVRFLSVGNTAPEIFGTDLAGQSMNLSDHRGKTVVLVLWTCKNAPMLASLVDLPKRLTGKPVVVVGVNRDTNRTAAQKYCQEQGITWNSWWEDNGTECPIAQRWNTSEWPAVYLIDAQGQIRYKGLGLLGISANVNAKGERTISYHIDQLVEKLMSENSP